MKLITLNTWGGKVIEPLTDFVKKYAADTDVFCFQEVFDEAEKRSGQTYTEANPNLYSLLASLLPEHVGYFSPTIENYFGNAIFIRKTIPVLKTGDISIYENPHFTRGADRPRKMQYIEIPGLSIMNVHGLWTGTGKGDTETRLEQSRRIRAYMDSVQSSKVICGDFNLCPDTQSLALIANGMNDLIKAYGVVSTRSSLYKYSEKYADYVFTSPDLHVNNFQVLPEEVSDHTPLLVDFT